VLTRIHAEGSQINLVSGHEFFGFGEGDFRLVFGRASGAVGEAEEFLDFVEDGSVIPALVIVCFVHLGER